MIDDTNQETVKFLPNLNVQKLINQPTTSEQIDLTNQSSQTSQEKTQQGINSSSGISGLIEVGLGTGLFVTLVVLSNSIFRKKEQ